MDRTGLYGQKDSAASSIAASQGRMGDADADKGYQAYVKRMASAVGEELGAATKARRTIKKNANGTIDGLMSAERAALETQAGIVQEMKDEGFSQMVAENTLNVGRAAHQRQKGFLYGQTAVSEAPLIKEGQARTSGGVITSAAAARNGRIAERGGIQISQDAVRLGTHGKAQIKPDEYWSGATDCGKRVYDRPVGDVYSESDDEEWL